MNKVVVGLATVLLVTSSSFAQAQEGLAKFPVVKQAITSPSFSAQIFFDSQQAKNTPKDSDVSKNFVQHYFSGNRNLVDELGKAYQEFCMKGPGEGCGAAHDLLNGAQYECITGPGEGCGGGRPPPKNN